MIRSILVALVGTVGAAGAFHALELAVTTPRAILKN